MKHLLVFLIQMTVAASLLVCGDAYTLAPRYPFTKRNTRPRTKFPFIAAPVDKHATIPPPKQADTRLATPTKAATATCPIQYSLGLGKNLPLAAAQTSVALSSSLPLSASSSSSPSPPPPSEIHESSHEACRFLVDHQAVREYQSPSSSLHGDQPQPKNGPSVSSTEASLACLPPERIRYRRQSEDVLMILEPPTTCASPRPRGQQQETRRRHQPIIVAHTSKQLDINTAWVEMLLHCEKAKHAKR